MASLADGLCFLVAAAGTGLVVAQRVRAATAPRTESADEKRLARKLALIREQGAASLQVVMDFDRTITSYRGPKGGRGATCHGILEVNRSEEIAAKAGAFNAYFYPIEVDPARSIPEKIPYMEQWYQAINDLMIEAGLKRGDVAAAVRDANVQLRPGVRAVFDFCKAHGVPLLIFSAGVGDVLKEVIKQQYGPLPERCRIVSNWMRFQVGDTPLSPGTAGGMGEQTSSKEPAARLVGWSQPLIHMFNKHEATALKHAASVASLWRPNVILVGDSVGDATMAREVGEPAPEEAVAELSAPAIAGASTVGPTSPPPIDRALRAAAREGAGAIASPPPAAAAAAGGAGASSAASSTPAPSAATGHGVVLRVGLCNDNAEALLPQYLDKFDVVLTRDAPLDWVTSLLRSLRGA